MDGRVLRGGALATVAVLAAVLLPLSASAATQPGDAEIEARWQALGGASGGLGPELPPPNDVPRAVTGGRVQDFTAGSVFWSSATGAWEVTGDILTYYRVPANGAALGFPAAAPEDVAGAGTEQAFTGGAVFSSAATGAHRVAGAVLTRYQAAGGPAGPLGFPTADEGAAGPTGSRVGVFEGGSVYWSSTTGARLVSEPVLQRYLALGGPSGLLGLPTGEEAAVVGGTRQTFQKAHVFHSASTGVRYVKGAILKKFSSIGGTGSYLGMPTSDETRITGGWRSHFVNGNITYLSGKGAQVNGAWRPAVQRVTAAELPYTYRSGCPVGPSSLRRVKMPYYDWSGVPRIGDLIVRASAADDMVRVFRRAHTAKFPIRQMRPVDVWQGNDVRAMEADNTSAFNCRKVTGNPYRLSQHSYGNAIDINTRENPYVTASRVYPSGSRTYLNRRNVRKGMIVSSGPIARGMRAEGWPWGARWSRPDYQHFSSNGR